jgi:hypothetical protein
MQRAGVAKQNVHTHGRFRGACARSQGPRVGKEFGVVGVVS